MAQELTGNALMEALRRINPGGTYASQQAIMAGSAPAPAQAPVYTPAVSTPGELTGPALQAALAKINPGGTYASQQAILASEPAIPPVTAIKTYTQAEIDAVVAANTQALQENAITAAAIKAGNTAESIVTAFSTGDWSGVVNEMGQPFTLQEQQDALAKGMEDNKAYYEQLKQKETQDVEAKLKQDQLDYQNYLATSKTQFEGDKAALDQSAAERGVLFSGGRVQKEKNLRDTFNQDQAYKQATMGGAIGDTARDYQYKYGNDAAGGLSQYYNLGGNVYNPKVATGGVTSGGLSNIYSTGASNFAGTRIGEKMSGANTFAANYLKNKSNKLQLGGYNAKI